MDNVAVPCMLMRGGTSKGPLFIASDLPGNASARDDLLLSLMGSPDIRQIDRIGGGDSLTSQALNQPAGAQVSEAADAALSASLSVPVVVTIRVIP